MFRSYTLRRALLLGVLAPLASISAILVFIVAAWAEDSLEKRLQEEIELIARAVAPSISASLEANDITGLRNQLDALFAIRRVYGVALFNPDGDLILAAGAADQTLRNSDAASDVVISGKDDGGYRKVDGQNVYAYFAPLINQAGGIEGLLQLTRQRQEFRSAIFRLHRAVWILWFVMVLLSLFITQTIYKRLIGRQVKILLKHIMKIGKGERQDRLEISNPREFSSISTGLNLMVESTREAEYALERRREAEKKMQSRLDIAERKAEIGRVVEGLAHELGAPLTVIDGRVRQLQRLDIAASNTPILQEIRAQVVRMTRIVHQLLHYGRRDEGILQHVIMGTLIDRLVESIRHESVKMVIREGVGCTIKGSEIGIEMAISNLLNNAVRHARSTVNVELGNADNGGIVVRFFNDGPPVAHEDRDEIFKPFFSREPTGSGTGLGLAIVDNIMRDHEGRVAFENVEDGVYFELYFPADSVVERIDER